MVLTHGYLDTLLCAVMLLGTFMLTLLRLRDNKGIGVRFIQGLALLLIVPCIAILALEGKLTGEGTGTVIGAVVGFSLSGIANAVPSRND